MRSSRPGEQERVSGLGSEGWADNSQSLVIRYTLVRRGLGPLALMTSPPPGHTCSCSHTCRQDSQSAIFVPCTPRVVHLCWGMPLSQPTDHQPLTNLLARPLDPVLVFCPLSQPTSNRVTLLEKLLSPHWSPACVHSQHAIQRP